MKILLLGLLMLFAINARTQVGINTSTPDPSSEMDIASSTRGVLFPRMSSVQRTTIINPAIGLLVFDTDTGSFWYYGSIGWIHLITDIRLPYERVDSSANMLFSIRNHKTSEAHAIKGITESIVNLSTGITGLASGFEGETIGVKGETQSKTNDARGVFGLSSHFEGATIGVFGQTRSFDDNAKGVFGLASENQGRTYGVYGVTKSTQDLSTAVFGKAEAMMGATIGVSGETHSDANHAIGVLGVAKGLGGQTSGVRGETHSEIDFATGVSGIALAETGETFGIWGENASSTDEASAVIGSMTALSGKTFGIRGHTNSENYKAAGIRGEGEGDADKAAAVNVHNGAITVSGAAKPAGLAFFFVDWDEVLDSGGDVTGFEASATINNVLIDPAKSIITLTPAALLDVGPFGVCIDTVYDNSVDIVLSYMGSNEPSGEVMVHYHIINEVFGE